MSVGSLDLDCGIAYRRLEAWLDAELRLQREGGLWVFAWEEVSCRVSLERLDSHAFGPVALERTRLLARGDEVALQEFQRLFTLRFMSAGG